VPKPQLVKFDNDCEPLPPQIWVTLCYLEKCCRPRDISCSTDDDSRVHTRLYDGFEIKLYEEYPGCLCGCVPKELRTPTGRTDGCCPEPVAEPDQTEPEESPDQRRTQTDPMRDELLKGNCTCYLSHYDGACDCGCGCRCVLIGLVNTTRVETKDPDKNPNPADPALVVDASFVRRIRPVLTGYYQCRDKVDKPVPEPADPDDTPVIT
jgi:hypothetical protein